MPSSSPAQTDRTGADAAIAAVLDARQVRAVYQPIVQLDSGAVVAYEALARGPEGTALETPVALFAAAASVGRLAELDWICRVAAFSGALEARLDPSSSLFVNSEPAALDTSCPADLLPALGRAEHELRVVVELTERRLPENPPAVLAAVAHARNYGWAVALDDVGAEPGSLAMMPFIRPDIVKLDMGVIQQRMDRAIARTLSAVLAYAERTGALVLAEGIENAAHLRYARSLGAEYGQGWHFGRPGALPNDAVQATAIVPTLPHRPPPGTHSPFALVAGQRPVRPAGTETLLGFSHQLEGHAMDNDDTPVVLACFQDARFFTPATRRRYGQLTARTALVAALGIGMPPTPVPGVRGGALHPDDPLRGEWSVVVVSPHYSAALLAKDLGDAGPEAQRRFDYVLTHDRPLVVEAARILLERIVPTSG
jgi:EAL domain-containing protein (putative c-di-GMP-specific phosphodiesterase class I)